MKSIKVEDSVGTILAHDLTMIVPGEFKGAAFKKGHIIQQEDIDELKKTVPLEGRIWKAYIAL